MDKKTSWILGLLAILVLIFLWRQSGPAPETADTDTGDNMEKTEMMEGEHMDGDKMMDGDGEAMMEGEKMMEKKEDGEAMMEKKEDGAMMMKTSEDLRLTAKAIGDGKVEFSWSAPEGLDDSNRFIIVRGEEANPEHSGTNYWIRQSHLKRDVVWGNNPVGTQHFRICLTENNEKDVCTEYSNDVEVEVK